MKHLITVTYKTGKAETYPFKDMVIGETNIDMTYPLDTEKSKDWPGDIELRKVKEITIK